MTKTIVGDIAGGQKPLAREIGSNLTIEHLWSIYRWYPGFRDILNLEVDAIFSNGINQDEKIDTSRLLECKEAWHPYINGIGFQFTNFSPKGHPIEVKVYMNANETAGGKIQFTIPHYPCEVDADGEFEDDNPIPGGYGFFHYRTQGNIRGVQGLPQYLHLIDTFKIQWDIMKAYAPVAEKQGMGFPAVFLKDNTKPKRAEIKSQWNNQPTTNRLLIMSFEDGVDYVQPTAGAYDPFPMLQWLNTTLSRASQMNRLMLEGEGAGALASSETAVSRWDTKQKEKQSYWKTQFIGTWIALGATDECNFKDPDHPPFISLMEGLLAMRQAMEGLVEPEDIITLMNNYLASNDQEIELHALPKEEMMINANDEQGGGDSEPSPDNKGSKTDKE